jgi:hypothetical protein
MAANFSAMAGGILWDMNVAIRGNVRAAFWQIRPPITKLLERLSRL